MTGSLIAADNGVLDRFTIPFGTWIEQIVNWVTLHLGWLLDGIKWPFDFLLRHIVDDFLVELPWWVLVLILFVVAWGVRNLTVAVGTAAGLVVCGLLGPEYWTQTAKTIGFILVAVAVCVIIGIPVGILSGRFDSVWSVVRPTLDAMQVIHAFVYLLPFIYFWGVGRIGATMATMVFALPPLIRLTNLGIRQVPEDVVEAARAYGAPEGRVLLDVQLPLARPAIMTGINQTLLLAFSMLGVAAIMGAGGLGQLLFRALGQQDVSLAASSGLAFFILAVVLDRIAQPATGASSGLFSRTLAAWRARKVPELLLEHPDFNPGLSAAEGNAAQGVAQGVHPRERVAIAVTAVGAAVMVVAVLLPWASGAALVTSYSRRADEALPGMTFNGLAAQGGSWFGIVLLVLAVAALAGCVAVLARPGRTPRWLAPDGAALLATAGLVVALAAVLLQPNDNAVDFERGAGPWVALAGGVVAVAGGAVWLRIAPAAPRRPLRRRVGWASLVLGGLAVVLALAAVFSTWSIDRREGAVITPELQAQIDEVMEKARAGEIEQAVAATEVAVIRAGAKANAADLIDGASSRGAGLGLVTLGIAAAAAVGAAVTAGLIGFADRRRWVGGVVAMGLGLGLIGLAIGWAGSLARATDLKFSSGVGVLFAGLAGLSALFAGRLVVAGFERTLGYEGSAQVHATDRKETTP